jgi:hypothetical protein
MNYHTHKHHFPYFTSELIRYPLKKKLKGNKRKVCQNKPAKRAVMGKTSNLSKLSIVNIIFLQLLDTSDD